MDNHSDVIWNVPNRISIARLILSALLFAFIPLGWYWVSFVVFVIAASTDWVDGWYARKYNQVSKLGRMLDPFCDKVLICGVFVLLAEAMVGFPWYLRIAGWMAVVVLARELLVTGLRGFVEQSGGDFSAKMSGKLKMWFQCIAAGACLLALALQDPTAATSTPTWLAVALVVSIWLAVLSTVYSGAQYIIAGSKLFSLKNQ